MNREAGPRYGAAPSASGTERARFSRRSSRGDECASPSSERQSGMSRKTPSDWRPRVTSGPSVRPTLHLVRRLCQKRRMRKDAVMFVDVERHQPADGRDAIKRVDEKPLMFQGAPPGFDHRVRKLQVREGHDTAQHARGNGGCRRRERECPGRCPHLDLRTEPDAGRVAQADGRTVSRTASLSRSCLLLRLSDENSRPKLQNVRGDSSANIRGSGRCAPFPSRHRGPRSFGQQGNRWLRNSELTDDVLLAAKRDDSVAVEIGGHSKDDESVGAWGAALGLGT